MRGSDSKIFKLINPKFGTSDNHWELLVLDGYQCSSQNIWGCECAFGSSDEELGRRFGEKSEYVCALKIKASPGVHL